MEIEDREKVALWKFSLIAPIINHNHGYASDWEYCRKTAETPFIHPITGKSRLYSPKTIKHWAWLYLNAGLPALYPETRRDLGYSRRLNETAQLNVQRILAESSRIPNTVIRKKLLELGVIDASVSQSTVDRCVKILAQSKKIPEIHEGKERKAFEYQHINQCWQADTTFLKKIDGRQVCLMLIIDDASRMVVGYGFFFDDNAVNFLKVLKKAVSIYGKPTLLYMDNGAPYRNHHLDWTCAQIGIQLIHTPVRDGAAKGKVERLNRTVKMQWLSACDWNSFTTLEDVERSFEDYLYNDYLSTPHSALIRENGEKMTPRDRYFQEKSRICRIPQKTLDEYFLFHIIRKVKTDATVTINKRIYDIPSEYMKENIDIYYDPQDYSKIWYLPPGQKERKEAFLTNKDENRRTVRKQHISLGSHAAERDVD